MIGAKGALICNRRRKECNHSNQGPSCSVTVVSQPSNLQAPVRLHERTHKATALRNVHHVAKINWGNYTELPRDKDDSLQRKQDLQMVSKGTGGPPVELISIAG